MLPWIIPAAMTAFSAANAFFNKPQMTSQQKEVYGMLQNQAKYGINEGRYYQPEASAIANQMGRYRQIAGARASARGAGRSSTADNSINQINAMQSQALGQLRSRITELDESVKRNALQALAGMSNEWAQQQMYQNQMLGQGLGQGAMMLQNALFPGNAGVPGVEEITPNPNQYSSPIGPPQFAQGYAMQYPYYPYSGMYPQR